MPDGCPESGKCGCTAGPGGGPCSSCDENGPADRPEHCWLHGSGCHVNCRMFPVRLK